MQLYMKLKFHSIAVNNTRNQGAGLTGDKRIMTGMANVFDGIPIDSPGEFFETLAERPGVKIERIVSSGHITPPGEWFDQDRDEFVLVVQGSAVLEYEDGGRHELGQGDWLLLAAHRRHRVAWTEEGRETVWLAVHF